MDKQISKVIAEKKIKIPLTVPKEMHEEYRKNYLAATAASAGRLFLFAGDQKIEHLNQDFHGENIAEEDADPKHLFEIASKAPIGTFATQLGLIARYAQKYQDINYVVKLNGRTNLLSHTENTQNDPLSKAFNTIDHVVKLKNNTGLNIVGIGYTIYLGSKHEPEMLRQAGEIIYQAHQHGLITILWCYPRGTAVKEERDPNIIAGACGISVCLGADFVKVNIPSAQNGFSQAQLLQQATKAAGNTGVICSGGKAKDPETFITSLYHQIHTGETCGAAIGRNIHQKSLPEAIKFCKAIASIIIDDTDIEEAKKHLK